MKIYIKGYAQRAFGIALAILIASASLLLSGILFQEKLNKISGQLKSYNEADYFVVYVLNYKASLANECIYVDTDAMLYLDADKKTRLAVSSLMKDETVSYNLESLRCISGLESNHLNISKNVADEYGIKPGDTIFSVFSYSENLVEYIVDNIVETNFDFSHPNIDNNIGMVYLGYDSAYQANSQSKYAYFAKQLKADVLSEYPQIINTVISKTKNTDYVFEQGVYILMFEELFVIAAVVFANTLFFSKSKRILSRFYLKGERKFALIIFPLIEKMAFNFIPFLIVEALSLMVIPCSSLITVIYYALPLITSTCYGIVTFCSDIIRTRKRGH